LPVPPSAATINVAMQKNDPNALLAWHQSLIRLKLIFYTIVSEVIDYQDVAVFKIA
jgi:hypothetical protein